MVPSKFILPLLLLFTQLIFGQPEGFPDLQPLLKSELVKKNEVRTAQVQISVKYDRQPIRESKKSMKFYFLPSGLISRIEYMSEWAGRVDTVTETYLYDENEICRMKITSSYAITSIEQNSYHNGILICQKKYQFPGADNWKENMNKTRLVWADSFATDEIKTTVYNQNMVPYRSYRREKKEDGIEVTSHYDQSGRLNQKVEQLKDVEGRIVELSQSNLNKHLYNWRKEFKYDSFGLTEEIYYREGKLNYNRRVSYYANGLPELDITRYEETGRMVICKVSY